MHIQRHTLPSTSVGTTRELVSFHYGTPGQGKKVYVQSSLHADELPGMLVSHHLRNHLDALEANGKIIGEIVLVPVANPIGLAQTVHGIAFGRFDLANGVNFNRDFRHLTPELKVRLALKLGANAASNVKIIRSEAIKVLADWTPSSETGALKKTLQTLAVDADFVLDLHCENEAVVHLYTGTPLANVVAPLSALLGARAVLVAQESGGNPFDEECSRLWWELAEHFGPEIPIPNACVSVTVELRGETNVSHALALHDAARLLDFLAYAGVIDAPTPNLPANSCTPTPLEGVDPVTAPHAGLLVFLKTPGDMVVKGEAVADLIDAVSGEVTVLRSAVDGLFFAHVMRRFAQRGAVVAKVAGALPFRTGNLLGD